MIEVTTPCPELVLHFDTRALSVAPGSVVLVSVPLKVSVPTRLHATPPFPHFNELVRLFLATAGDARVKVSKVAHSVKATARRILINRLARPVGACDPLSMRRRSDLAMRDPLTRPWAPAQQANNEALGVQRCSGAAPVDSEWGSHP